ncbi:MAG: OadG family protein [Clostridia bacterium]|nr:OadG family protein [Clostridia bacterium]
MFNILLDIVPNEDGNFYFDNYGEPFLYALIGFLVVFLGICILILIIWLIGLLMRKTNNLAAITQHKQRSAQKKAEKAVREDQERQAKEFAEKVKRGEISEEEAQRALAEAQAQAAAKMALAAGETGGEEEIPTEVVAAIMAAIMAYYEKESPKAEFVVRRIKRL